MKVLLDEIITALFSADDNVECYYDAKKQEVFIMANYIEYEMTDDELEEYLDRAINKPKRLVRREAEL